MSLTNFIWLAIYTALTCVGLGLFFRYRRVNPIFWFPVFQWLMAAGTISIADFSRSSDRWYVGLFFLAKIAYFTAAAFYWGTACVVCDFRRFWARPVVDDGRSSKQSLIFIVAASLLITVAYYQAVGGNIFLKLMRGIEIEDYSSTRLAMYSGEDYFAPGYVNQFKNVLLPVGITILGGWAWIRRAWVQLGIVVLVGGAVVSIALLGTGQRAFLMYSYAALLFGVSAVTMLKWRKIWLPTLGVFALFAFVTSFYQASNIEDSGNRYGAIVSKAFDRFFVVEQTGALGAFRHLIERDVVYFREWKDQFVGIVPGVPGSTLQHELFFLVHGTDRGTESYAVLTGFYHNGGMAAVPVCYALMAFAHSALYHRFLRGRRTVYRSMGYAAVFFYLAIFVSGGPVSLIDNGVITLLILLLIRKLRYPRLKAPVARGSFLTHECQA
jgi:hypothetical protein